MKQDNLITPKYKDTTFRMLFNDKEELLSLYNALNGTNYDNPDEMIINTIGDSTFMKVKNDVSFIFNYELGIFEHQSTPCPNMPLRDLFYVAKLLKSMTQKDDLYRSKLIKIPSPKFFVFYNGTEPMEDTKVYKLSEQFEKYEEFPDLELIVTLINVNEGHNPELMAACETLKNYSIFVAIVRKYIKDIASEIEDSDDAVRAAIEKAIDDCINRGILKDFFEKHRKEVVEMEMWDYNEELHYKTIAQEKYEDGYDDGYGNGYDDAERNITALFNWLLEQGRDEDVKKAILDKEFRMKLLKEYDESKKASLC